MKRRIAFILLLCLSGWCRIQSASAANDGDIKAKINAIKCDEAFLGAEATRETEAEAYHQAIVDVHFYFNQMRLEQQKDTVDIMMIRPRIRSLVHERGSMFRVFAYVRISDIDSLINVAASAADRIAPVEPVAAEKPKEVIAEAQEKPQVQVAEVADTAQKNDAVIEEKPVVSSAAKVVTSAVDVIMSLRQVEQMGDALLVLRQFQKEGKLQALDKVKGLGDVQEGRFLLVYDKEQQVKALLEVLSDTMRNVFSNQTDALANYKGCSAYWFN